MPSLDELLQSGAVKAARGLLGWQLFMQEPDDSLTGGTIIETEAYHQSDAASHSFNGETPRTKVMFGPAGYVYVYFTYGMHWCMNIVTGEIGGGEAVLIRAIQPTTGLEIMQQRRGDKPLQLLTDGPAKLCQALGVTGVDNGLKINSSKFILRPPQNTVGKIMATPRIGIRKDTHRLWRFVLTDEHI